MSSLQRSDGTVLAREVRFATTLSARVRGLIGTAPLKVGQGLVITPAKQIHTLGLGYAIDAVFLDESWEVLHVLHEMRPRRVTRWVPQAKAVVELQAGAAEDVVVGERLVLAG